MSDDRTDQDPPDDGGEPPPLPPGEPDEAAAAAERDAAQRTVDLALSPRERLVAALTGPNVVATVLAFVTALLVGAVLLAASSEQVRATLGYFFDRPGDAVSAVVTVVIGAYGALLDGAVGSMPAISETLVAATPLILTGLAVAIPLRAGMFNIGGEGQLLGGVLLAGLVGFGLDGLPAIVHLPLALLAGLAGGLLLGFIPGILKARTGAHEVITTIMLNNILVNLTAYLLITNLFQQPGRNDPISQAVAPSSVLPRFVPDLRMHTGIILALLAAAAVWWLLERSTFGFELNAVGLNRHAAVTAGMSVGKSTAVGMTVAGGLAGLAGASQVLGVQQRITLGISAGLGFDGITVALLGRGSVGGTVAAGLLFGGLKAGGRAMQAQTGTSLDLVVVLQALIILFIAAPALIRALFRIRAEGASTGQVLRGWGT